MSATTAKIAALAKTENTGIVPELAQKMYDQLGSHHIAIVEFKVAERTEGDDDSHAVKLEIRALEPADDDETDEYLRNLQRALYFKRNPQPALTEGDPSEPSVDEILANGGEVQLHCAHCEHRYADRDIAHTRNREEGDGFLPCSWKACGHVVDSHVPECQYAHEGVLHLV